MTPAEMYRLLDQGWNETKNHLPVLFSTQDFQTAVRSRNSVAWNAISSEYGEGGKGSGEFYSPNNILFNYLKKLSKGADLTHRGLMPSSLGWGSRVVTYWELPGDWSPPPTAEEDQSFVEGGAAYRKHLVRERRGQWRQTILASRMHGGLRCEGCDITRPDLAIEVQEALFEVHHIRPLNEGERQTIREDLALLCACCHRVAHKVMRMEDRNITISELRTIVAMPTR